MTRAKHAMEALKAGMMPDTETNIGINEAYRQGLEDMVNWIDFGEEEPRTGSNK